MRSISRLCVVVLTGATERVDGIVEVGSAKVVGGMTVCNDNILPAAVAFAVDVDELNISDGRHNLREKNALTGRRSKKIPVGRRSKRYYSRRVNQS